MNTTETKHTPGPWFTQESDHEGGVLVKPIPGQVVCQVDQLPEMEANARLIAAAPDLLECLILACEDAEVLHDITTKLHKDMGVEEPKKLDWVVKAEAAIKKAINVTL